MVDSAIHVLLFRSHLNFMLMTQHYSDVRMLNVNSYVRASGTKRSSIVVPCYALLIRVSNDSNE
jgi:hypothetical protein